MTGTFAAATRETLWALVRVMVLRTTIIAFPTTKGRSLFHRGCLLPFLIGIRTFELIRPFLVVVVEVWFGTHNFNVTFLIRLFKTKSDIDELVKRNF